MHMLMCTFNETGIKTPLALRTVKRRWITMNKTFQNPSWAWEITCYCKWCWWWRFSKKMSYYSTYLCMLRSVELFCGPKISKSCLWIKSYSISHRSWGIRWWKDHYKACHTQVFILVIMLLSFWFNHHTIECNLI